MMKYWLRTVCQYIDGLVVEVEEAPHAAAPALQRAVAGQHVRVELQVLRHVAPMEQSYAAGRLLTDVPIFTASAFRLGDVQVRPLPPFNITDTL